MVKVNFKLSEAGTVSLNIDVPERLDDVLSQCAVQAGVDLGGYIAVRKGKVITGDELIHDSDEIDVFPAISGG